MASQQNPTGKKQPFGFRFIDHTADMVVEAWGRTIEEAFEQAGYGFFSLLLNPKTITPTNSYEIALEAHSLESLLYKWIEEFIYLLDAENLVCTNLKVNSISANISPLLLTGTCNTEQFDPKKHEAEVEVKAMTFAELKIIQKDGETLIRYTLDL